MTDYAPIIAPVPWSNIFSTYFCDLLSICATNLTVTHTSATPGPPPTLALTLVTRGELSSRAGALLRRELVARLNTGSLDRTVDIEDQLISPNYSAPAGKAAADRLALQSPLDSYVSEAVGRFSVGVPRIDGSVIPPNFVQANEISNYNTELAAVLSAAGLLSTDVATQAAANVIQDSAVAATVAAALVTARAAYVTQLQATYPTRGFA